MIHKFKNPELPDGNTAYALFVHKLDGYTYKDDCVKEKLEDFIKSAFDSFNCSVVEVNIVYSDEVIRTCCADCYDYVFFDTAEYSNDEIMYPMSRYRPQLFNQ